MRPLLAPPVSEPVRPGPVPTFSVVITAYQVAEFLGEAVESALDQTAPPLEVIVCDDGSTDDVDGTLSPFQDRITLIRQERRGPGAAKPAGARLARGDFVDLLDGDDAYLPTRLEALGELASVRPDLDILLTYAYIEIGGRPVRTAYDETWPFEVEDQRQAILKRNFVLGHAAVRRERLLGIGDFDDPSPVDDWDCWACLILAGSRVGLVQEPLYRYRVREGSLSSRRVYVLLKGVERLERLHARDDLSRTERRALGATLAEWRRELALGTAREALMDRDPNVRRQLVRIALGQGYAFQTRLKAAASAAMPRWAGLALARRERLWWVGAAGVRVKRGADADGR